MTFKCVCIISALLFASTASAEMQCGSEMEKSVAEKAVQQFVSENNIVVPDKPEVIFRRSNKTCHYIYIMLPTPESSLMWQGSQGRSFYVNPNGKVVSVSPNMEYKCPLMNIDEKTILATLKRLRMQNPSLPREPENYKVDFFSGFYCSYSVIEYKYDGPKKLFIIPPKYRINTFYFDFFGDLYDYHISKKY